jgi:glycosyltransferase involved in cell wall biosynthesis
MERYRIAFVIEQALGHITHAKNLQANVPKDSSIKAYWALVPFETQGLAARLPVYKSNWTVRSGWRARRMVNQLASRTKFDALFFHTQVPAILATNWIKKIPSVVSLDATPKQYDSLGEFYAHDTGPAWMEKYKWQMNVDCFHAARHLVAWAKWTKDGIVSEYDTPAEKITVIPPGVNVREWLRPTPRAKHDGATKILFVGGDLKRKGGVDLLNAFRTLRAQGKNVELHLATRDTLPDEPQLFVYNNMQPNSEPLKQLYRDADIFCLPTYGDCLPMVLSEAGAAGLPSVSTNIAGIPEIVHEGKTGFVVPRGDVPALTNALAKLIDDDALRLKMGDCAIQVVTQNYDAETNARRLLDLLKDVADNK